MKHTILAIVLIAALFGTSGCGSLFPPRVEGGKVTIEKHDRIGPVQGGYFEVLIQPPAETAVTVPVEVVPADRIGPNRYAVQPAYERPWWDWFGVTVPRGE